MRKTGERGGRHETMRPTGERGDNETDRGEGRQ